MTTIVGVQGADGIVLCADMQETRGGTREFVTKIDTIGPNILFGGAGETPFISMFETFLLENRGDDKAEHVNIQANIDTAITEYVKQVDDMYGDLKTRMYAEMHDRSVIQGVLAHRTLLGHDKVSGRDKYGFSLYEIETPSPSLRINKIPFRACAGSGGVYARLLFKNVEIVMDKIGIDWVFLHTRFISQFCDLLLSSVTDFDAYSRYFAIYEMTDGEKIQSVPEHLLFIRENPRTKFRLSLFLQYAIQELGQEKIKELFTIYNVPEVLSKNLSAETIADLLKGLKL